MTGWIYDTNLDGTKRTTREPRTSVYDSLEASKAYDTERSLFDDGDIMAKDSIDWLTQNSNFSTVPAPGDKNGNRSVGRETA